MPVKLIKRSQWEVYLSITIAVLIMITMVSYRFYIGDRINQVYVPSIEAAKEIKLSVTQSHLWFEEILSGDKFEKLEHVMFLLDQADWYANAMLKGDQNELSVYLPVEDVKMREHIVKLHEYLQQLRSITEKRYNVENNNQLIRDLDLLYDGYYLIFNNQADLIEARLFKLKNDGIYQLELIQVIFSIIAILLALSIGIVFYRFENEKKKSFTLINQLNTNLEKLVEERTQKLHVINTELAKSQEQYQFLAKNSHDVVLAYDANLIHIYVSPAIEILTGYTVEETVQMKALKMVHPDDKSLLLDFMKEGVANNDPFRVFRYRRLTKDRGYIWVETAASFIYNNQKQLKNIVINIRDISKQVDSEKELKEAGLKLLQSDKMASLGVLTAGIAHEINNPINFVYAGINSLEENLKGIINILHAYEELEVSNAAIKIPEIQKLKVELNYEKLLDFVQRSTGNIKTGAERTSSIIKGLSLFSRADDDKLVMADINESLESTLLLLSYQFKNRVNIVKTFGKIPLVQCYPVKLSQVFVNILINAVHAIEDKGTITISTDIAIVDGEDFVKVSISDTGKGMSEKIMKKIFDPFFTSKEVGVGTGLGLSISHGIIEDHKGCIEVESEEGKGSTFIIYLPLKPILNKVK